MQKVYDRINWENYPSDATPINEDNLNKIDYSVDEMDRRIVNLDGSKADKTEVAYTIIGVNFKESTGTFQFLRKNGTTFEINTALEKIATNFEYDYITQKLKLTLIDQTVQEIDLSDLITQYEFIKSDTICFELDSDGKVSAKIINESITEDMLDSGFLADLKVDIDEAKGYVNAAEGYANAANTSANTAALKAIEAGKYASAASEYAKYAEEYSDSAESFKNSAKESYDKANDCRVLAEKSASAAADSATNAETAKNSANASATAAANSMALAKTYENNSVKAATEASDSAVKAESYAVGGTGTRTGEDTDNAKYYNQQASGSADSAAKSASTASTEATNASSSATAAASSATNAASSASAASSSATSASTSKTNAANSATAAATSASAAAQSATTASEKASAAASSATNAASSASAASNYATGSTDSAKYYYEQAKSISESFAGTLRPKGTVTFANLPSVSSAAEGDMYNISNQFTTTSDFKEGIGRVIPAGANIYKTSDGKWDILAGTPVTGVKGNEESSYRQGNVNITPENIGALPLTGGIVTGTVQAAAFISNCIKDTDNNIILRVIPDDKAVHFGGDIDTYLYSLLGHDLIHRCLLTDVNGNILLNSYTDFAILDTNYLGFSENGKNYPVELDTNNKMYVNVPWTDNNTTYSEFVKSGSGAKSGLVPAPSTTAGTTKYLREDGTWTVPPNTNTTYSAATSSALGLVKIGYTASGKNYPVQLDSSNKMYVNVPWTDTNTTYSAATTSASGLMSASDKTSLNDILTDALKLKYIWYANKDAVAEVSNPLKKIGTISSYKQFGNVFVVMYASALAGNVVTPGTASTVTPSTTVGGYSLFNNGDLLAYGGKYAGTEMWKRIPMYEAKTNLDGLMSAWDKTQVNKISGIETTANNALSVANAANNKNSLPVYLYNDGVQGDWLVNGLYDEGWYLGGITADCDEHPPILNGNGTSWAILVLNGMNMGDANYNHRLQIAFDLVNSKIYMRRGWISAGTWADTWTDVANSVDSPVFSGTISTSASTATGKESRAFGHYSTASGGYAFTTGYGTTASGNYAYAGGFTTTALTNQYAIGHYNNTSLATAYTSSGTSTGTAFVIGNGTSSSKSNAFRITGEGVVYAKGAYNATGADYAEFAEWADGNSNNEDRRGYFVTYDEEKPTMIRIANEGEYILGIVSANPCVIGNSDEGWIGRYVFDEFGSIVYEEREEAVEYIDEETGEVKTKNELITTYKLNPDYDPEKQYVHRKDRKEWAAVGWIGVLAVRDDGTCISGGYCKVADGGIATYAERGFDTYRVLERVTDNIIKVALK